MIGKKDIVIAVLATFCLTATLFMVLPTRSQYDPWIDANDDGVIDSTDLGMLGNGWGTFGDPTKNVIIAGHSTSTDTLSTNVLSMYFAFLSVTTMGYKEITCVFDNVGGYSVQVTALWLLGDGYSYAWEVFNIVPGYSTLKLYEVHGWQLTIRIDNPNAYDVLVYLNYYMST